MSEISITIKCDNSDQRYLLLILYDVLMGVPVEQSEIIQDKMFWLVERVLDLAPDTVKFLEESIQSQKISELMRKIADTAITLDLLGALDEIQECIDKLAHTARLTEKQACLVTLQSNVDAMRLILEG